MLTPNTSDQLPDSIDTQVLIGPVLPPGECETRLIGIASLTGVAAIEGASAGLGNATDFALLNALRVWSDAVLVGAETVRKEDYFGARVSPEKQQQRKENGQSVAPPIVVLSRSLGFDTSSQLFSNSLAAPIFAVPKDMLDTPEVAARAHDITEAGGSILPLVDDSMRTAIEALHMHGMSRIVCEGGPQLNTQMLNEDAVDVFHYTISPHAVLQPSEVRLFGHSDDDRSIPFVLESVKATSDSLLFCRYRRVRDRKG
ncbi:pyrimidine reductase family protein [Corynebacterium coyleae]|uniref:pyrimidine reductase family protein n=1 Tax=Corynebacterium coyleae TaxID=53374 RepID=UPI00254F2380|nr:pyrimidine reductase family protein [Corynebacterium coyleae]MDK8662959.1 pyrimidine reductase family protein [Corynebacterium coyleae]MDK8705995.1 pyrimidine reductase family protein [Corynebacterium coyleae]MDK8732918.1 pyrimidine reductase family protein [Corynebacterium coyleae]MDK8892036.1 pyrimidine reductase family protein [Corynebacterium coyleae]